MIGKNEKNKVVSHVTYFQEGSHASHVTPLLPHHSIQGLILPNPSFYLMRNWLLHRISLRSKTVSAFFVSTKVENLHSVPTTRTLSTTNHQIPLTMDPHLFTSLPTIHSTIPLYSALFHGTTMARIQSQLVTSINL